MDLSPEVHASIVKVAGDWALECTKRQKHQGVKKDFDDLLEDSFERSYYHLLTFLKNAE